MRKDKAPEYEIVPTMSAYWVVRVVGDRGQLIEKFTSQSAAEDFVGFLNHAAAVERLMVNERRHRSRLVASH